MRLGVRSPLPDGSLNEKAAFLKRAGFEGIELGPEYNHVPSDELLAQLDGTGIAISAIVGCVELLHPDKARRQAALETDKERLRTAKTLGASAVIEVPIFGGPAPGTQDHAAHVEILEAQLRELAVVAEETDVTFLIEPLNRYETRFMNRLEQAADICERVHSSRVKILADFFHMQIEERVVSQAIRRAGEYIGYVHVVDSNRFEPGAGHTDFRAGFDALRSAGYDGWLVIESGILAVEDGRLVIQQPLNPDATLRQSGRFLRTLWQVAGS
jgi:sugar phosphate isomerase/epimerase